MRRPFLKQGWGMTMRLLMWFSIGFAAACAVGVYLLPWYQVAVAAAIAITLFAAIVLCSVFYEKVRPIAVVTGGMVVALIWLSVFNGVYLKPVKALENQNISLTIYLSEYSEETEYGSSVEGYANIQGKHYHIYAYLNQKVCLGPGDCVTGTFQLRNTTENLQGKTAYRMGSGIYLIAYPRGAMQIAEADRIPFYGIPAYLSRQIHILLEENFDIDVLPFAQALLLGDTSLIDYKTDTALKLSGIRHVVAVSGLHVSILFSLVYTLTGRKRFLSLLIGLPLLFLFAAVAGFTPSITRACIMHALMISAALFEKEYDPPTALAFAVLCILIANPYAITSVSFQLSVGCLVGIFLFSEPIRTWLMDKKRLGRWSGKTKLYFSRISSGIATSLGATIVTTPLCAFYFGTVSLIGILTNLLTLWLVTYVFYGIILSCCMSVVNMGLGKIVATIVGWPIRYILWIAKTLVDFPLSAVYTQSAYIVIWLIGVYCLLAVFIRMKKKRPLLLATCATFLLAIALLASWIEPLTSDVCMSVLNTGQGQCILLQSDGKTYLVDCGGDSDTTSADIAAQTLLSRGISRLDGVILTHFDRDHAGGISYLLERLDADTLYLPACVDEDGYSQELLNYVDGDVILVDYDMRISFGSTNISLFHSEMGMSSNESGLCILFQHEDCDILITGDRTSDGEHELMRQTQLPELDVLIVGHHGSKTSTCQELLDETHPEIAIISVGENRYGHPTEEVLERLITAGCEIYRTDLNGTIVFRR